MRILLAYSRFPWPTVRGDQLTVFKLLEYLGDRHELDLLCVSPVSKADLDRLPVGIRHIEHVANSLPERVMRLGRAVVSNRSLQVDSFFPPAFFAARGRLLTNSAYDIIYSHYIRSYGHDNFDSKGAKKVIGLQLSHQAHFAKAAQTALNPLVRWLYALETRRLQHWEAHIAGLNDLVHIISKKDMERIRGHGDWADRVFINPHGVDETKFLPVPERQVPGRIVFTGNLKFQANEDAITWFMSEIWPLILDRRPDATLLVAGANPAAKVRRVVLGASRTLLQPNPKNMWEVIQTAEVAVDPLRIGAGLQNKILEAMACGLPVVSTTLANEGIGALPGDGVVLADEPVAFANAVAMLLGNRERRRTLGISARAFIERAWSWEYHFEQLEDRWRALVADGAIRQ